MSPSGKSPKAKSPLRKRASPAARVRAAQVHLAAAEQELAASAQPWWRRIRRHRGAIAAVGGLSSGMALTLLPPRWWARFGAALGTAAALMARSSLTPALIGAALAQLRRGDGNKPESTPAAQK